MELYNFLRIGGMVIKIASFRSRRAEQYEASLHKAFQELRFHQTRSRRVVKLLLQAAYAYAVYYALRNYNLSVQQLQAAYIGFIVAFFTLFHAEIKIGISNNADRRASEVSEDLSSGYTEWFAIPWPFVFFIPVATWFRVSPISASIGLSFLSGGVFFIYQLLKQ